MGGCRRDSNGAAVVEYHSDKLTLRYAVFVDGRQCVNKLPIAEP